MIKITKKELVDSIAIPIMSLGQNTWLSHKIRLSKPDKFNNREYYHKEFKYISKYIDPQRVTTLKLTHSSILTIENKGDNVRESLVINITNRNFIVKSLSAIKKILKNPELFIEHDGKYIVNPKLKKDSIISFKPYKDKIVVIKPCVIEAEDEYIIGVELSLEYSNMSFIRIPIETYKTFVKIIKKFDFHIAGLAAITYLQSSEIGNNEVDITRSYASDFDTELEPTYLVKAFDNNLNEFTTTKKKEIIKNKGW